MKKTAFGILACLALPAITTAEPLQRAHVPAHAKWLVHVDVDAFKASTFYSLLQEWEEFDLNMKGEDYDEFRQMTGMDPMKDLQSVTAYGFGPEEEAVVVLEVTDRIEQAIQRLPMLDGYQLVQSKGYEIHVFSPDDDGDESVFGWLYQVPGRDDRYVVLSNAAEPLLDGIDAMRGVIPTLATEPNASLIGTPAPGAIVFASVGQEITQLADMEPASMVARLAQSVFFQAGEQNGEMFAYLTLDTASTQDAIRVQQIMQGATALVGLVSIEEPEVGMILQDLVESLYFDSAGARFTAEFRYDTRTLIEDLKALDEF